jgi:hypothetical protein
VGVAVVGDSQPRLLTNNYIAANMSISLWTIGHSNHPLDRFLEQALPEFARINSGSVTFPGERLF